MYASSTTPAVWQQMQYFIHSQRKYSSNAWVLASFWITFWSFRVRLFCTGVHGYIHFDNHTIKIPTQLWRGHKNVRQLVGIPSTPCNVGTWRKKSRLVCNILLHVRCLSSWCLVPGSRCKIWGVRVTIKVGGCFSTVSCVIVAVVDVVVDVPFWSVSRLGT